MGTDRPTDRPTDRRTDKAGYRVACMRLKMDSFLSRHTDEKIVTVALKIVFLTCGFFCWLALEHLYRCEEKNLDIGFEFWGKN